MNFVLLIGGCSSEEASRLHGSLVDAFGPGETLLCTPTTDAELAAEFKSAVDRATLESAALLLPNEPRFLHLTSLSGGEASYLMWCEDGARGARATVKAPGTWTDALTETVADLADGFAPPMPRALWIDRSSTARDEEALDAILVPLDGPDWQVTWTG